LSDATERVEYDSGPTFLSRWVNPAGLLNGNARLMQIAVFHGKVEEIALNGLPLGRPITDELRDLVALLGAPDHIMLETIQGDYSLGYAVRFLYLERGLQVSYFGEVDEVRFSGQTAEAVCLGRAPSRDVKVDIQSDVSDLYDTISDWANRFGVSESELLSRIFDSGPCLPVYP
jgi:hypothetical protein